MEDLDLDDIDEEDGERRAGALRKNLVDFCGLDERQILVSCKHNLLKK